MTRTIQEKSRMRGNAHVRFASRAVMATLSLRLTTNLVQRRGGHPVFACLRREFCNSYPMKRETRTLCVSMSAGSMSHYAQFQPVRLNHLEGFVRQVIGWRELIAGMYVRLGTAQRRSNFWHHYRPLPAAFYTGTTGILPLDHVIKKSVANGPLPPH